MKTNIQMSSTFMSGPAASSPVTVVFTVMFTIMFTVMLNEGARSILSQSRACPHQVNYPTQTTPDNCAAVTMPSLSPFAAQIKSIIIPNNN